jgi:hypothetical protein
MVVSQLILKCKTNNVSFTLFVFLLLICNVSIAVIFVFLKKMETDDIIFNYDTSYWDELLDSKTLTGLDILQYFLWSNSSSCLLVHDFGGTMKKDGNMENLSGLDGQKAVCLNPNVAPKPDNCIVYSFGINNEWSFDEDMEEYGCEVFAFDPSKEMMSEKPYQYSPHITFYNWGLSNKDEEGEGNWPGMMRSLSSIYGTISLMHHQNKTIIDYLKMDIEYVEWEILPCIIQSGILSKVRQLGIEFHLPENESMEKYRQRAKTLRLLEKTGMVRFDSKYNPWFVKEIPELQQRGSRGYEIAWYNSNLTHIESQRKL